MVHLADIYRILEDEETILPGDEFNLSTLPDNFWGACDKFVGQRVRNVGERGKIKFRRLEAREVQV